MTKNVKNDIKVLQFTVSKIFDCVFPVPLGYIQTIILWNMCSNNKCETELQLISNKQKKN